MAQPAMSAKKGAMWLSSARMVSIIITAISTVVLARLLSPHEFGVAAPAAVILALASALFDGALGISLVRRASLEMEEVEETFGAAIMCGFVLAAIVAALAPMIARIVKMPGSEPLLALSAMLVWIRSAFVVLAAYHQRSRSFKWLAIATTSSSAVGSLLVSIILALLGCGAWSITIGAICGAMTEISILFLTSDHLIKPRFGFQALRRLGTDEGAYVATSLANWGALSSPTLIAAAAVGATQIGIYSRSQRILEIVVSVLAAPLQRVLLPKFVSESADPALIRQSFHTALEAILVLSSLAGAVLCLHGRLVVAILLGTQWTAVIPVLQAFMIVLCFRCAYKVTESVSIALGSSKAVVARQILYLALSVVGAMIGSAYGATGVAIGTSCAVAGFYLASLTYAAKQVGIGTKRICAIHLRAAALSAILVLAHFTLSVVSFNKPFWVSDLFSLAVEAMVLLAIFGLSPKSLLGPGIAKIRSVGIPERFRTKKYVDEKVLRTDTAVL